MDVLSGVGMQKGLMRITLRVDLNLLHRPSKHPLPQFLQLLTRKIAYLKLALIGSGGGISSDTFKSETASRKALDKVHSIL